ncbi:MAG: hypothetical protein U0U46_17650 [Saprospiraceae bacterium]
MLTPTASSSAAPFASTANLVANDPETSYADPDTAAERGFPASSDLRVMPNPFSDALTVAFDLETPSRVQVVLADLTGRFVFFEKDNWLEAGPQSLVWNTEDLPGCAYLVGLKVEGKAWTYRTVMLMR